MPETTHIGIPTAPGIVLGEVFLYRHADPEVPESCILNEYRPAEVQRFEDSVVETARQLSILRGKLALAAGESVARIFDAQLVILEDEEFVGRVKESIRTDGVNAEAVVAKVSAELFERFNALNDELFRQRAQDIRDVSRRLVRNLLGKGDRTLGPFDRPAVLVSDVLLPSDVAHLLRENITAVVVEAGEAASHMAIMTRTLEVPAVVGLKNITSSVRTGDAIIVNGNSGKVISEPNTGTVATYTAKAKRFKTYVASLADIESLPAETLDGRRLALRANIELPGEAASVVNYGGEGIGLLRSEYLFLARNRLPDEDEQFTDYVSVIKAVAPHPVTVRTFDLGGDKVFPDIPHPHESNPFMGWRAVRVSLDEPQLFRTQLRAIYRASAEGKVRLMLPFIQGVQELRSAKAHLRAVQDELKAEGLQVGESVEVGIMVELPSAALLADRLAREVDFFSIGTNDLTQFTLAVDRGNERVRALYRALHPAVIRLIKMTVDAGHRAGIEVALCGEMGGSPLATMLLVGLGLDELSVSPLVIPQVKKIIRSVSYEDAKALADKALELDTADELSELCSEEMKTRFADLPIWFND